MARWFDSFFSGMYADVLSSQFDEAQSLGEARIVKRLHLLQSARLEEEIVVT